MRNIMLAGAGAIALMTAPALAQSITTAESPTTTSTTANSGSFEMSDEQTTTYDTWPADRQTDYDSWPMSYQEYYWTLEPVQQEGYWALTPDQRGKIYDMTPEQRAIAWKSVQQQLAGMTPTTPPDQANPPGQGVPTNGVPNPQMANQAVQPAMPANQEYQGGPYKGALTPPPAQAMNKEYPPCKGDMQDSCVNPREAGLNYGNRPLDYWPGQPASEMKNSDIGG